MLSDKAKLYFSLSTIERETEFNQKHETTIEFDAITMKGDQNNIANFMSDVVLAFKQHYMDCDCQLVFSSDYDYNFSKTSLVARIFCLNSNHYVQFKLQNLKLVTCALDIMNQEYKILQKLYWGVRDKFVVFDPLTFTFAEVPEKDSRIDTLNLKSKND